MLSNSYRVHVRKTHAFIEGCDSCIREFRVHVIMRHSNERTATMSVQIFNPASAVSCTHGIALTSTCCDVCTDSFDQPTMAWFHWSCDGCGREHHAVFLEPKDLAVFLGAFRLACDATQKINRSFVLNLPYGRLSRLSVRFSEAEVRKCRSRFDIFASR